MSSLTATSKITEATTSRKTTGGYPILDAATRKIIKGLVSEKQKPKYWKEKRLFR